jgi:hypothetical protein
VTKGEGRARLLTNGRGVQEQLLAQAGKNVRAQMRALYPCLRTDEVEDSAVASPFGALPSVLVGDGLDEVSFDSPAAKELARRENLTWADFASSPRAPSGPSGFTREDVETIIAGSCDYHDR